MHVTIWDMTSNSIVYDTDAFIIITFSTSCNQEIGIKLYMKCVIRLARSNHKQAMHI